MQGAINPIVSDLYKHVDLKYKFLVDHITQCEIIIHYVPTHQMNADLLTKNLKNLV